MDDQRFADLISKMAHELRSPLTSIKGFSATLVKRWDRFNEEQRFQFVETIHSDAERMSRIVSEVLDLARIESGRLELNRTRGDLAALARRVVEDMSALPGAERIAVKVPGGLEFWADADRLRHVLDNLLENAIKFSDEGPIEILARADEGTVVIEVVDRGVGIPSDRLPSLFEGPAPAGGHASPHGSGSGLYLARRLIEAHGGTIGVRSRPEDGSTFTIRLPAPATP